MGLDCSNDSCDSKSGLTVPSNNSLPSKVDSPHVLVSSYSVIVLSIRSKVIQVEEIRVDNSISIDFSVQASSIHSEDKPSPVVQEKKQVELRV